MTQPEEPEGGPSALVTVEELDRWERRAKVCVGAGMVSPVSAEDTLRLIASLRAQAGVLTVPAHSEDTLGHGYCHPIREAFAEAAK